MENNNEGIIVRNLSHCFSELVVLNEVNISLNKHTFVAVIGPSGCGKTTLLKLLTGLLPNQNGEILLGNESPYSARKKGKVGFAFQSPTLLPWRTVIENVMLPLEILHNHESINHKSRANELLKLVGLEKEKHNHPFELSGGMQQRVGLARALVTTPSFLFLDEPFGALDGLTRSRLNENLRELWSEFKLTILFVTHSIEEAIFLADHIIILTPKPSSIQEIVEINLGNKRDIYTRTKKEFTELQREIIFKTKELAYEK